MMHFHYYNNRSDNLKSETFVEVLRKVCVEELVSMFSTIIPSVDDIICGKVNNNACLLCILG